MATALWGVLSAALVLAACQAHDGPQPPPAAKAPAAKEADGVADNRAPAQPAAPDPQLPAELGFQLTEAQQREAEVMRRSIDAGQPIVPARETARPWLLVVVTHPDDTKLARSLVAIRHRSHTEPGFVLETFADHHADLAVAGARLLERLDPHLEQLAIELLLVPLLDDRVGAKLRTAIDALLQRVAAEPTRDPAVRGLAAGSIADGLRMHHACTALFEDADQFIAWMALKPCARPENANRFIALLHHPLPPVRARAAQCLARATTPKRASKFTVRYLLRMLDDPEPHVRGAALEGLGHIGAYPGVADAAAARVTEFLDDTTATAYAHDWTKDGGGSWRTGNVPLILDRSALSAQAQAAFNRMSDGAITTSLGARDKPTDEDRKVAGEQAQQWLSKQK